MEDGLTNADQEHDDDFIEDGVEFDENKPDVEERIVEHPPISGTFARMELERFSKDYFRSLLMKFPAQQSVVVSEEVSHSQLSHAPAPASSLSMSYEPDLRVPVGGNFVHLAQ